jgi:hypothetical protein
MCAVARDRCSTNRCPMIDIPPNVVRESSYAWNGNPHTGLRRKGAPENTHSREALEARASGDLVVRSDAQSAGGPHAQLS